MTEVGPSVTSSDSPDGRVSDRLDDVESRLTRVEELLAYRGDEFDNKLHQLQSLVVDVRQIVDALLDAGYEHTRDAKVDLATQQRETIKETADLVEQISTHLEDLQGKVTSTSKVGKAERILEFADGKRGNADIVALPSEDIYGLLNDCSQRRCRQLMDELASALSFCETDRRQRRDGKQQKRLKVDFSRFDLDAMKERTRRSL